MSKKLLILLCVLLLLGASSVTLGHWDESMGHKMHWPQLPQVDLGWDVCLHDQWLAVRCKGFAVQSKPASIYAVGIPPRHTSKKIGPLNVFFKRVVPQNDILRFAVPIRHHHGNHGCTIGYDLDNHAVFVNQSINVDPGPVMGPAEFPCSIYLFLHPRL